jgi:transposase
LIIPPAAKFAIIRFLHAKNMSAAEIHHELCAAVYGQNVMSEGSVRQGCKKFKRGRINVQYEERSGWPSVVSDDLQKICERRRFTISEFS